MLLRFKLLLSAILIFIAFSGFSQTPAAEKTASNNPYGISNNLWITYSNKTNMLLEKVDEQSFLNYIIFKNDGNFSDKKYFVKYIKAAIKKDKEELIYKVGKGSIATIIDVKTYFSSLQSKYIVYYADFIKNRNEIIETLNEGENKRKAPIDAGTPSLNCGSPCTNPGFEAGTGFWDYSSGVSCATSSTDPCNLVTGFSSTAHDLVTVGTYDAAVGGTVLPVVPPGGGSNAMELGDYTGTGSKASRASISFTVSAANANFTYRYAVVLQDPQSGHTDPERPYFRVKVRDAGGNVLTCGDYEVMAKPPMAGFIETSSGSAIWYRPWTTVFIPLSAFIGQCITVEFTVSDCSQGGHFGYAYIDGDCDPLQLVSSSPSVCGGNAVALTAPSGGVLYTWTNTAGGTTGIVGPTTGQTIQVNQAGTYEVAITMVTGPTCITHLDITIGSNPLFPVAQFTNTTVCAGSATQFTDTSTPVGSVSIWSWDFDADGVPDAATQNPSHTFPAAGTYPVSLIVTWGSCTADTIINVTVNPITPPTLTPAGPFCATAPSVNLVASVGGGTWSGTGIVGGTNITGAFNPAIATIGNNTISYNISGACPTSASMVVAVNAIATINAGADQTICNGNTVTLAGSIGGAATTGTWSGGAGTFAPNNTTATAVYTPTVAEAAGSSVTLTFTSDVAGACGAVSDQMVITIDQPPTTNAGLDQTICVGSSATLSGIIGGSATTATWSGGTGSYTPNNSTLSASYLPSAAEISTGTVTLTLTTNDPAGQCSSVNDQMIITINPIAIINAGLDQTICIGSSVTLAGTIGGATTTGTWSGGAGSFTPNNSTTTAVYTPTAAEEAASGLTLTFTSDDPAGPCSFVSDQMVITINQLATANAGPAQTICAGTSATLAGSVGGTATSGTWGGGNGVYNPNNSTLNATYTPSAAEEGAGSVTLTLISNDPAGPCPVASNTVTITINPIATINAGPDQTICIGSTVTLAGTTGGATTTGTWSGGAGSFNPNNTTANAVYTPSAAEEAASGLTLTFTSDDPAGPCSFVSDQMVITIDQLPTTNAGLDQTICAGSSATLAGIIGGTATTATWSGGTGTFTPNNSTLAASYLPGVGEVGAGTVTLTLTTNIPPGLCPAASDQMVITINPIATIDAGPDQTICIGSTVALAGTMGGATSSGTWSGGAGSFTPNNTTATAVYTPTAAEGAANGLTLTFTSDDPAGPCSFVSDQMVITINQLPTVDAGPAQSVCKGASLQLAGSIGGSATNGTWSGGTGTYVPSNNTLNAVYTPSAAEYAAGTVTLTLTTDDPTGPCLSVSENVTFSFYLNPVVNFTVDKREGCPIHCVQFSDLSTVGGGDNIVSWDWNFGDGSPDSISQNPSHCYSIPGYYDVTLTTVSNNGCSTTYSFLQMIHVYDVPVAEFSPTPNPASILESTVTLINQSSNDVNYWNWQFGDGDSIAPNVVNPVHTYPNEVAYNYTATLIVQNVDGCYDTISHEIIIGPEFTFFIPNAFTPNGDAVNDFFFGTGIGIAVYDIFIFDRWGNMIYHGDNIDTSKWDGKANQGSDIAQQDVYVWKVKLTDIMGKKHNYIGTVTLVK